MLTQQQAVFFQWITVIAILLSPIIAVSITLWYENRREKRKAKLTSFLTLMSFRKSYPGSANFGYLVNALNTIDVVFHDVPEIIILWHEYFDILQTDLSNAHNYQRLEHKWLDMLNAMAAHLGYKNLKQTDLDKFYSPIAFESQTLMNAEMQKELLRVLKNTHSLLSFPKEAIQTPDTNGQ